MHAALVAESGVTELGDYSSCQTMDPETATRPGPRVPIASQYAQCEQFFSKLIEIVEKSNDQAVALQLLNEFGRFRVWAGNAGAHRTAGRVSLDYRLREASHIYEELTKLLGELKKNLEQGRLSLSNNAFVIDGRTYIIQGFKLSRSAMVIIVLTWSR